MSLEIEAKIRVPALTPVADKLKELGAVFLREVHQADTYFMDADHLLRKKDCALRIREQIADTQHRAFITFKGARTDSKFKNRPEYETGIENVEMMVKIFDALGYHKRLTVEKKRILWSLDSCEVCLDELPLLGFFVEVEGPDEAVITQVLEKLNLQDQPHISQSYASMISEKLKLEGSQEKEVRL